MPWLNWENGFMKILTILGSPRLKGNTASVLSNFERRINARFAVERVDLAQRRVNGCFGCNACQATGRPGACTQQDEGPAILEQIVAADAVIYATPLYAWSFSAQMKALIDRHYCFVTRYGTRQFVSRLQGKPMALLVTCGGPVAGNADLIRELFARLGAYGQSRIFGTYVLPHCTDPEALGDQAATLARRMARDLENLVIPRR
jgi:NAD(P)H-dependent FMN reductase